MAHSEYKTLAVHLQKSVAHIEFNRPEYNNSYNSLFAKELIKVLSEIYKTSNIRIILISGRGTNFCSGADLSWMRSAQNLSPSENKEDLDISRRMFQTLLQSPIPLIAKVHGKNYAGGIGIIASCDIVFSDPQSTFSISEAKWGLIPGVITPILINKIGLSRFLELSITAREFNTQEALTFGLIHHIEEPQSLDLKIEQTINRINANSEHSILHIKKMAQNIYSHFENDFAELLKRNAELRQGADFLLRSQKIVKND